MVTKMLTYSIDLNDAQIYMMRKLICQALRIDAGEILTDDQERILSDCLDAFTAERVYA